MQQVPLQVQLVSAAAADGGTTQQVAASAHANTPRMSLPTA